MFSRFIRRFTFVYKNAFGALSPTGYIIYRVVNPFLQLVFFCTVASYVYGSEDATPWVIGNALSLCYFSAFYGVGQTFVSERMTGTLKSIICSPSNTLSIVLPRILAQSLDALVSVFVGFAAGIVIFNYQMPLDAIGPSILVILVAVFSAMGLGLLIGSFALLTRDINMLMNLGSMVLIIFSGSNFHVNLLPLWIRWLSTILPLSRSIELMRYLAQGHLLNNHLNLLYGELILGLVYYLLGLTTYHLIEKISLKQASLDLY